MNKASFRPMWALLLIGFVTSFHGALQAADRRVDDVLTDLATQEIPSARSVDRNDPKAVEKYLDERNKVMLQRADLILELYRLDPEHEMVADLMGMRWQMLQMLDQVNQSSNFNLDAEVEKVAAETKNQKLRHNALFMKATQALKPDLDDLPEAVEAFIKEAPNDERGASLLYRASMGSRSSADAQRKILERLIQVYPTSQFASGAKGTLRQLDGLGTPFELEFNDAVTGAAISMKDLRGKVVVIDFWATWCGPCVAEMPKMKNLYKEYRDQGVEFIGVSLDQPKEDGGLDKLKKFVEEREIGWPQYYQGKGWKSDFSRGWGINAIPALFVVDQAGKLHSVNARGRLESILSELLKKPVSAAGN